MSPVAAACSQHVSEFQCFRASSLGESHFQHEGFKNKNRRSQKQMGHTDCFREPQYMGPTDFMVLPMWVQLFFFFLALLSQCSKYLCLTLPETHSVHSLFVFLTSFPASTHTQETLISFHLLQHYHSTSPDL